MTTIDSRDYNRRAWDAAVKKGNRWTIPVSSDAIAAARRGEFEIVLTPEKPVPADWFPPLAGARTLCLASGGGQQGPILAAAGADVTVFDNSPAQLGQDRMVADRDGLVLTTVEGDMRDLSAFDDASFDLIVHPCSNSYVPDVNPVWTEAFRVLRPGGVMLAGFCNPILFVFDDAKAREGELVARHSIPYSDHDDGSLTAEERAAYVASQEPWCFGHTLEDQIGGQLRAGFHLVGFYEDSFGAGEDHPLDRFLPGLIATRALRPDG